MLLISSHQFRSQKRQRICYWWSIQLRNTIFVIGIQCKHTRQLNFTKGQGRCIESWRNSSPLQNYQGRIGRYKSCFFIFSFSRLFHISRVSRFTCLILAWCFVKHHHDLEAWVECVMHLQTPACLKRHSSQETTQGLFLAMQILITTT